VFLLSCFFLISAANAAYSYSANYTLLSDSTFEANGLSSSLTGTFSFAPLVLMGEDGLIIPVEGFSDFNLGDLTLSSEDGTNITQDFSGFGEHDIYFPGIFPVISTTHSMADTESGFDTMNTIYINRTYLTEPTENNLYFVDLYLAPLYADDTEYNYFDGFDSKTDVNPDEVYFTYQLVETTYTAVKTGLSDEEIEQWIATAESSQVIGTLTIHGVNTVPVPGSALLLLSGFLGLLKLRSLTHLHQS
jgi:hypothetical protein